LSIPRAFRNWFSFKNDKDGDDAVGEEDMLAAAVYFFFFSNYNNNYDANPTHKN